MIKICLSCVKETENFKILECDYILCSKCEAKYYEQQLNSQRSEAEIQDAVDKLILENKEKEEK